MSYLIKMPQMGLEMEEGEVVAWEVDEGQPVETGDVIAMVESEKAANEVEAREDGVVREKVVPEGGVVEPGDPIGIFGKPDEDISELQDEINASTGDESMSESAQPADANGVVAKSQRSASSSERGSQGAETIRATPGARELASEHDVKLADVEGTGPQGTITEADVEEHGDATGSDDDSTAGDSDVRATPGAKQVASELGVDLSEVKGTGPQGVITEDDVESHEPADGEDSDASTTEVRATPGAKQLAIEQGLELSAIDGTGPQGVITEDDVSEYEPEEGAEIGDATRTVSKIRDLSGMQQTVGDRMSQSYKTAPHVTLNRSFDTSAMRNVAAAADRAGADVSLTDLLLTGVGAQLAETPEINALYEDGEHKLVEEVNIGVAVDVDDGLVTPVVPSVATKSVETISSVRGDLTKRALSGDFEMSDMAGGTFTVTNLGMFGIDSFDPIINPPEVAILGVGRVREDDTMTLSLSFDHRVVNGADAARFLDGAVQYLTDAKWLANQFDADVLGALIGILSE